MAEMTYYCGGGQGELGTLTCEIKNADWIDIHGSSGATALNKNGRSVYADYCASGTTDKWHRIVRTIISFNITDLPASVNSAKIRLYNDQVPWLNGFSYTPYIGIYRAIATDPSNIVIGDFDKCGSNKASDTLLSDPGKTDWVEFPLNAATLAALVQGWNDFSVRLKRDAEDSPSWENNVLAETIFNYGNSGSYIAQLVIDYTPGAGLAVTTDPATGITTNSVTLNGTLVEDGSDTPVTCSFEYGLTTSYELGSFGGGIVVAEGDSWSESGGGLSPGTTYHFRAKAVGDSGATVYGGDRTFTTKGVIYPTEALTRVTALVHRYDRRAGIYQLEITLGDITSVLTLPYDVTPKRATAEKQQEQEAAPVVQEAVEEVAKQLLHGKIPGITVKTIGWKEQIKP